MCSHVTIAVIVAGRCAGFAEETYFERAGDVRAFGIRSGAPTERVECAWRVEAAPGLALQITFTFRSALSNNYEPFCRAHASDDFTVALYNTTEEMPDPRGELEV